MAKIPRAFEKSVPFYATGSPAYPLTDRRPERAFSFPHLQPERHPRPAHIRSAGRFPSFAGRAIAPLDEKKPAG